MRCCLVKVDLPCEEGGEAAIMKCCFFGCETVWDELAVHTSHQLCICFGVMLLSLATERESALTVAAAPCLNAPNRRRARFSVQNRSA